MIGYDDERWVTACHEASHAIAARERGYQIRSITIEADAERLGYTAYRSHRGGLFDEGFIAFAGIWGQARARWAEEPIDGIDGEGFAFDDYVAASLIENPDDANVLRQHYEQSPAMTPDVQAQAEQQWQRELEVLWPQVTQLARELVRQRTDTAINGPEGGK